MRPIVIYYSYGGNTRRMAEKISKALGADIAEIKTVSPYTGSYEQVVDQGQREVDSGFMPEIQPLPMDLEQYDTVILGTPVWWYTFAPAMKAFLHRNSLAGKTVHSFATNGGWIGHTFQDFAKACLNANVKRGLNIRFEGNELLTSDADISAWVNQIR